VRFDARNQESVCAVIDYAHRTYGRLDILHNNAGGSYPERDRKVVDSKWDVWEEVFAWNMYSTHWACQAAIPLMIAGSGGAIVNTVTAGAFFAQSTLTAYGAAKGALASYTRYVAVEYGCKNIRCNGVAPGLILRPASKLPQSVHEAIGKHTTTPRLGKPEDIGNLVAFLASDAAGYINGQIILVDGGVSVRFPHDAEMVQITGG
jgi:NAD(P)-dependent dehydrogenase (short-subunit alcohol dehydrogenase family)